MKQAENKSEKMKYRLAEAMKNLYEKENCFSCSHLKQMNTELSAASMILN